MDVVLCLNFLPTVKNSRAGVSQIFQDYQQPSREYRGRGGREVIINGLQRKGLQKIINMIQEIGTEKQSAFFISS